ncbi:M17 family metallopeptidase [Brevibacterium sp.]|uniref:M17 family metallopeptidase n=1 Tax=Brevibacterium sp. TaxID=1701 RepID=UPI002812715C|nr:M17 family metallopeptidase [Brevibacterium sp.]
MPFLDVRDRAEHPRLVIGADEIWDGSLIASDSPRILRLSPFPSSGAASSLIDWGRDLGHLLTAVGESSVLLGLDPIESRDLRPLLAGILDGIGGLEPLGTIDIVLGTGTGLTPAEVTSAIEIELALRRGTEIARELTNARANQLGPAEFARRAEELAAEHGLGIRVWDAPELEEGGFGGIIAIGQGSKRPPALVELWLPGGSEAANTSDAADTSAKSAGTAAPPTGALAFAGKGITFDTGGHSLKSPDAMYSMHTDCAGAAAVLGGLVALAMTGSPCPIHAVLPLAENVPGPESVLPGDVVTMRSGAGLEIVDTDFEGRVVLADALALIGEHEPAAVVTLATLTYQAMVALGPEIAAVLARDDELGNRLLTTSATTGEEMWRLPWAQRYADQIRSDAPGATLRNHPRTDTGRAITAALLLGEFVADTVPFAHIDFAGPAVRTVRGGPEATGWGVRTVHELATDFTDSRNRRDR